MDGQGREDLREQLERLVGLAKLGHKVSLGTVRLPCVWLHQHIPLQDYRRQEGSKDPIFRELLYRQ